MKNSIEKETLTNEIYEAIKSFTSGACSQEEAQQLYVTLEQKYSNLKQAIPAQPHTNILASLCYVHNIENYAIFTGIFRITEHEVHTVTHYGDAVLHDKIVQIIKEKSNSLDTTLTTLTREDDIRLKNNLYIYKNHYNEKEQIIITTLSSSHFFDLATFKKFYSFIETLRPSYEKNTYDCTILYHYLQKYISQHIKNKQHITAGLFYFPELGKIFNHMGVHTFTEVTNTIRDMLQQKLPNVMEIFILSLKEYVVFFSTEETNCENVDVHKLSFTFRNIPLPFASTCLALHDDTNAHLEIIEQLFVLKQQQGNHLQTHTV